ncbi:MAG: transposase [Gemmatimonadota bacterium]|nr:transposase [Gemmatimonadota bacterium]
MLPRDLAALGHGVGNVLVDWRRFERPGQLACYLGLVSREDSSGNRQRLGSITKAGNSHCRPGLVQAGWSYRHRPQISVDLKRRQAGQPPAVITHAWKAQQRLHARFNRLSYRKWPQVAVVAVARELVGFDTCGRSRGGSSPCKPDP